MSLVVDQWKAQLGELSTPEKAELALFLLSSLKPEDESAEAAWDEEATNRVASIRAGKAAGRPVGDVLTELREQYP
jgi:hypothetical protein